MDIDTTQRLLRQLPSIDKLLQLPAAIKLLEGYGRTLTLEALREAISAQRQAILANKIVDLPADDILVSQASLQLQKILTPTLKPIINATGIIVHTNLGRAPLSQAALAAMQAASAGYSTLEYDIKSGKRGSRAVHAEQLLRQLTGAEAALVVNNNAAAVLLMLTALCQGKEVIISRGQLVEIGGGFRVPDVMAQSGAKLVEVGTTNRTHLRDYAAAITENTAAILVAHHSNYKIIGFTSEPSLAELAELTQNHNIMLLYDQGSGAMLDVRPFGLDYEPTVSDGIASGIDMTAFSGDKLLGGPQAGILCGQAALMTRIKRHPLARAVRSDKMCLAALSATLVHFLKEEAVQEIPVWQMIGRSLAEITTEAEDWATNLQNHGIKAQVIAGESRVGGGSLPGSSLPTKLVAIESEQIEMFAAILRNQDTPVVGRIQEGRFLIDPRTVLPAQKLLLLQSLVKVFGGSAL